MAATAAILPLPTRLVSTAIVAAVVGCAAEPIRHGQPKVVNQFPIAPYERHEECVRLAAGDKLDYRFEAQLPVAFSIRYTDHGIIVIPISRDNVEAESGVFQPRFPNVYCLLWEAGQRGAIVDYRIRWIGPEPK